MTEQPPQAQEEDHTETAEAGVWETAGQQKVRKPRKEKAKDKKRVHRSPAPVPGVLRARQGQPSNRWPRIRHVIRSAPLSAPPAPEKPAPASQPTSPIVATAAAAAAATSAPTPEPIPAPVPTVSASAPVLVAPSPVQTAGAKSWAARVGQQTPPTGKAGVVVLAATETPVVPAPAVAAAIPAPKLAEPPAASAPDVQASTAPAPAPQATPVVTTAVQAPAPPELVVPIPVSASNPVAQTTPAHSAPAPAPVPVPASAPEIPAAPVARPVPAQDPPTPAPAPAQAPAQEASAAAVPQAPASTAVPAPAAPAPAPANLSWAARVGHQAPQAAAAAGVQVGFGVPAPAVPVAGVPAAPEKTTPTMDSKVPSAKGLPPLLEPRGITNPGNKCFLNVVLQSLLACPPMASLLSRLSEPQLQQQHQQRGPLVSALTKFYGEFKRLPPELREGRPWPKIGTPPVPPPVYLYDSILAGFARCTGEGDAALRQQDAQELFTFLVDALHEELSAKKAPVTTAETVAAAGEWTEVSGGRKGAVVLSSGDQYGESPVSEIFFGRMRSTVRKAPGTPDSSRRTATIQPFHCLHLDVADARVRSIEDAIRALLAPEAIKGYRAESSGEAVSASKLSNFESLPHVLCLHLKRFAVSATQGVVKVAKRVTFGRMLTIDGSHFSLVAVIRHHGDLTARGHYTCDVLHGGRWWLACNDSALTWIRRDTDVLRQDEETYMLFYSKVK